MAGGTGAGTAAIGLDPRNAVVARAFHHGQAVGHLDHMFLAAKFHIGDLRHSSPRPAACIRRPHIGHRTGFASGRTSRPTAGWASANSGASPHGFAPPHLDHLAAWRLRPGLSPCGKCGYGLSPSPGSRCHGETARKHDSHDDPALPSGPACSRWPPAWADRPPEAPARADLAAELRAAVATRARRRPRGRLLGAGHDPRGDRDRDRQVMVTLRRAARRTAACRPRPSSAPSPSRRSCRTGATSGSAPPAPRR